MSDIPSPRAGPPDEREQLDALAHIVESTHDAVIGKTLDGMITSWNHGAEMLFGYQAADVIGRSIEVIFPADRLDEERSILESIAAGRRVEHYETRRRRADGTIIDVGITVSPVRDREGGIVGASSVSHDISERRRQDALVRSLVEFAPDAIVVVDQEGHIHLANSQRSALFGYAAGEVVGEPVEMLLPERFREVHIAHREGFLSEPETRPMGANLALFGRRRDGTEFPVDVSIAPLDIAVTPGEGNARLLIAAAVRDVTDRKQLEVMRDEFIANAAHELRTPIATIVGLAETLADYLDAMSAEQVEESLAALKRQGERANALVRNLLDLSQLDTGRVSLDLVPVDVGAVTAQAVEAAPPPTGRTLDVDTRGCAPALADEIRLVQVIVNLLTNAYRYGGENIVVRTEVTDRAVVIHVVDDGPAIPDSLTESLFDPFTRGPDAGLAGGSGIGLALCRRLTSAFGGTIAHSAVEPSGAAFSVRLVRSG